MENPIMTVTNVLYSVSNLRERLQTQTVHFTPCLANNNVRIIHKRQHNNVKTEKISKKSKMPDTGLQPQYDI